MKIIKLCWQHSVRMMLAAVAIFLSLHAHAAQGYAVLSDGGKTLTFKYGIPTGTPNVDYYDTDDTRYKGTYLWGDANVNAQITTVVFEPSFSSARPVSCDYWFYSMKNLTSITGIEYLNTSEVTGMSYMFYNCSSLTSLDVTNFDTSKVTGMNSMFYSCRSLTSLDVTKFNTSKVTGMSAMFSGCRSLTSLDVTKFNTSNVTTMTNMFYGCRSLTSLDVTKFNTSKVTGMSGMFWSCSSLTSLDVTNFNTSNVTTMGSMFHGCSSLTSLDVTKFNTSKVTAMNDMFNGCRSLTPLDVTKFNTSKVTAMNSMFQDCSSLTSLDVTKFNTSNVTTMTNMFNGCSSLTSLDVTKFNTSKVTGMNSMFQGCSSLTSLDVTKFNTSNVTAMNDMFKGCSSLTSLDVTNFDTSKVTDMSYMFYGCNSLISLDLRNFNTSKATNMSKMFSECFKLKCVVFGKEFSRESISNLNNINNLFYGCSALRYVDFYLSDDTDAINSANVKYLFPRDDEIYTAVVYLPHGSQAITDRQNFVYSYNGDASDLRCPMYYSVDKVDIEFPRQFITNEAVYDRTATMGGKVYGSVTLPYDFKSNADIQAYALTKQVKENGKVIGLTFSSVQTVSEHTPFAFKRLGKAEFVMKDDSGNFGITVFATRSTSAAEKTWTVAGGAPEETAGTPYDGTTGLSNWKTKGYYVKETKTDYAGMYFIQDNYFKRAVGPLNLVDHRVLFYPTDGSGAASVFALSFVEEDMATAIEAAETEQTLSEATEIYDASGCRLSEARKGLNIIRMSDGTVKKVFIK